MTPDTEIENFANANNASTTGTFYGPRQPGFSFASDTQTPTVSQTLVAPALTPTATAEPTVAQTLQSIKDRALQLKSQQSGLTNIGYETGPTYEELHPEIDEREVMRQQRKLFQSEIDATNRVYDDMLAQERLAGQGRLGTGRAIAARGGLLGSDFGEAQRNNIVGANLSAERAVQNERQAKIGAIMGTMRKAVADALTEKRLARQQGAENYISYLASSKERKANNANIAASAILQAGLDPTKMDPAEIEAIGKEAGLSLQDILMAYSGMKSASEAEGLKSRKTEAEIAKLEADAKDAGFFNLSEGQSRYDADGNVIASKGKTYAPGTGSSSSISLTTDDKRTLLGGGWAEADIPSIEQDVRTYGLTTVIENAKANGATSAEIKALQKAYGSTAEDATESVFNREYVSSVFNIPDNEDGDYSFLGMEWGENNKEKLDTLMDRIEVWKAVGKTDEEIYNELSKE